MSYTAANRMGARRWRGSAKILGINGAGATVRFQSQNSKVPRYCARNQVKEMDVGEAE